MGTVVENVTLGEVFLKSTVKPGYDDIGFYDVSPIQSDILWCQLIRHC